MNFCHLRKLIGFIVLAFIGACTAKPETKPIQIGIYEFDFPLEFEKNDVPGINNYVSIIQGDSIRIIASYGYYPNDFSFYEKKMEPYYIETGRHAIRDDTIDDVFRRIVIAEAPKIGRTAIYLEDQINLVKEINSYQALDMYTTGISKAQQELVLEIYKSGRRIN